MPTAGLLVGTASDEVAARYQRLHSLHLDLRTLRYRLHFDRMQIRHVTDHAVVANLRYGKWFVPTVLRTEGAHAEVDCEVPAPHLRKEVAAWRDAGERRQRMVQVPYGLSTAGSDRTEWRVRDVEKGTDLPDRIAWTKFTDAAWTRVCRVRAVKTRASAGSRGSVEGCGAGAAVPVLVQREPPWRSANEKWRSPPPKGPICRAPAAVSVGGRSLWRSHARNADMRSDGIC